MKKLLITGISGLLGSNIAQAAKGKFEIFGIYYSHPFRLKTIKCFQMDLTEAKNFQKFENISPNFIIHCAALTNVDYCEKHLEEAYRKNTLMSSLMAEKAKQLGAYLIHISTDSVFDGNEGNYNETSVPHPINIYGKTKLEAEESVLSTLPTASVVRTTIYGWNYQNKFSLAEWMIHKLEHKIKFPAFRDTQFSPILVNDLAEILFMLEAKEYKGLIHVASGESCSKFEFALLIAKIFGLDRSLIEPVDISQLKFKALRGKNNSLDARKAERILNIQMPSLEDGLRKMRTLQEEGFVDELRNG